MKRRKFLAHLKEHGCIIDHEGKKHTVIYNPKNRQFASVPRHTDINDFTAAAVCTVLQIPRP